MSFGTLYARAYDLLYREKDYAAEAAYVDAEIRRVAPEARSILDLGSGTGRHAVCFAELGHTVHGVERSADMLALSTAGAPDRVSFAHGDLRDYRADRQYDAVVSLFHVFSYLPTDDDVWRGLETARAHLPAGGVLAFDYWYGPAVLRDKPSRRARRVNGDTLRIERVSAPTLLPEENTVRIDYRLTLEDRETATVEEANETHSMRYFFTPEIDGFLQAAGFRPAAHLEWMTTNRPDADSWYAFTVAQAV